MSEFSAVVDNLKENNEQTESLIALQEQEADAVTAAGGKSARDAAAVEESRENARSQNKIIAALQGMKESIGNLGQSFSDSVKDKAKAFGGNIVGVLKKLLIGGALAAFIAFMNSEYWEKTKKVIVEDIVPALVSVYENVLQPLFTVIKDVFIKQWENIKVLFDGIGEAITKFKEGDILGGITGLIGSLGTFFMDTIDNLITGVFNLFAGLFGLEGTDSVFGSIGKFINDTWNSITGFFTDYIVTPAKQLFTDIGNFFTETIPEKFTEITGKVTSFFTDIVSSITGFFTDGFNFVTETIPNKLAEITSSIAQKFVDIKNDIIDFALAPFRKVKELFDNLLIGILESVEGIPFLGGKAKEMKENILASRTEENANTKTDFASQIEAGHQRFFEDVDKNKDEIKKFVEGSGYRFSLENSKSMYNTNQDSFIFKKPNGESFIHMNTDNFNAQETLDLIKSQPQITAFAPATAGMSGSDMNAQSAEFVGSGNPTGVDVKTVGGTNISTNSSVVHNSMSEETGTGDKSYKDNLYDF